MSNVNERTPSYIERTGRDLAITFSCWVPSLLLSYLLASGSSFTEQVADCFRVLEEKGSWVQILTTFFAFVVMSFTLWFFTWHILRVDHSREVASNSTSEARPISMWPAVVATLPAVCLLFCLHKSLQHSQTGHGYSAVVIGGYTTSTVLIALVVTLHLVALQHDGVKWLDGLEQFAPPLLGCSFILGVGGFAFAPYGWGALWGPPRNPLCGRTGLGYGVVTTQTIRGKDTVACCKSLAAV